MNYKTLLACNHYLVKTAPSVGCHYSTKYRVIRNSPVSCFFNTLTLYSITLYTRSAIPPSLLFYPMHNTLPGHFSPSLFENVMYVIAAVPSECVSLPHQHNTMPHTRDRPIPSCSYPLSISLRSPDQQQTPLKSELQQNERLSLNAIGIHYDCEYCDQQTATAFFLVWFIYWLNRQSPNLDCGHWQWQSNAIHSQPNESDFICPHMYTYTIRMCLRNVYAPKSWNIFRLHKHSQSDSEPLRKSKKRFLQFLTDDDVISI